MAKVIVDEQTRIVKPWWDKASVPIIGAGIGLVWWIATSILRNYVVEPLACRDLASAGACVDSFGVAGMIAAILVALLGTAILVRTWQARPLVIALATAALLWSLGSYMNGLVWFETLVWAVILYALSYTVFSFVVRLQSLVAVLIVSVLIVAAIRLLLSI